MTASGAATRFTALFICAVTSLTVVAGCASGGRPATMPPSSTPPVSAPSATVTTAAPAGTAAPTTTSPTAPSSTAAPSTIPATTTTTSVPAAVLLRRGDSGPAVIALQQRLSALGYWLGPVDGRFGDSTEQATFAVQKAAGLVPDGVAGPLTDAALARGAVPHPQSTQGRVLEVDLEHQLVMLVDNAALRYTLNTSTGGGYLYTSGGVTSLAYTPRGHFSVLRQVDGLDVSPLGELWRPKYFYSGYAVHGSPSVPPVPVSHGCVRISNEAIDWIWSADLAPIGSAVWVY